ncbi:alpha/beta hydrolase [Nocardia stercoris]|uniref:Alpha/beta hydrolase n=1 Tax=Nocardia stercoris TaxID=2483361 RepID=A0A3M2LBY2_9NOCA|nr:alpha/beta hydrolase [Nocardia stercoris]RMI35052.1 alpha/beta hydrolase [Nocardia stercoris]
MSVLMVPRPIARAAADLLFRVAFYHRLPWSVQRALLEGGAKVVQPLPPGVTVERITLAGRPAERVTAGPATVAGAVLYLHGGAYTVGSPATHRSLVAHLAVEVGCPVYALDYRLAPEHPYPAGLDDAVAAFAELVRTQGISPGQIAVAGDSAGGGLSLATAQRLIGELGYTPAALGLIAPWANPGLPAPRARDTVINRRLGLNAAAAYGAGVDPGTPGFAPIHGRMAGLPPTYVQVDDSELLLDQSRALVAALEAAGVDTAFTVSHGMWHVSQLQASLVREAAVLTRELAGFLRNALATAGSARAS